MKNSQELHRKTFELTLALYRVTDFFPRGETLKRQLREKANEIFGGVTEYGYADSREQGARALLGKVETMQGYLRVSRSMRFVRQINLTILEREYALLELFFREELRDPRRTEPRSHEHPPASSDCASANVKIRAPDGRGHAEKISERQKKILGYVEKTSRAKIGDLNNLLEGVSVKTIQRDLHDLVQKNMLQKDGEKRWTVYSLQHIR